MNTRNVTMSTNLDLPTARRVGSLSIPSLSPPSVSTASNSRSGSRSSSYSGQDSKRLSFRGQSVKVILPSITPEISQWIDDVLLNVKNIHELVQEGVRTLLCTVIDNRMSWPRARRSFLHTRKDCRRRK